MAKQWKRNLSGDDVQAEVEDALEKDISQLSPAANSVAANLDGGVAAVDWSSKTPNVEEVGSNSTVTVNGSGFLIAVASAGNNTGGGDITIDGTEIASSIDVSSVGDFGQAIPFIFPFDSTLEVTETFGYGLVIVYVLD